QKDCIAKFLGKINHNELLETAADYEERGQSANAAMLSAVNDKINELELQQTKVYKAVREAYVKDGGKPFVVFSRADQEKSTTAESENQPL
ncbi:hypothetical protein U2083_14220, partial [Listeria monocytogenes]|uniref:hypothetical protein n=1 Tax=Listeria monocytogenes TaxID=1639 RepID=UPI002FDBB958